VLNLIDSSKIRIASGTSLTLSEEGQQRFYYSNLNIYKEKIILLLKKLVIIQKSLEGLVLWL